MKPLEKQILTIWNSVRFELNKILRLLTNTASGDVTNQIASFNFTLFLSDYFLNFFQQFFVQITVCQLHYLGVELASIQFWAEIFEKKDQSTTFF